MKRLLGIRSIPVHEIQMNSGVPTLPELVEGGSLILEFPSTSSGSEPWTAIYVVV